MTAIMVTMVMVTMMMMMMMAIMAIMAIMATPTMRPYASWHLYFGVLRSSP
jgi:hypothetical protein